LKLLVEPKSLKVIERREIDSEVTHIWFIDLTKDFICAIKDMLYVFDGKTF
jgi:hypothetical protein